jgi:hypothetical protein
MRRDAMDSVRQHTQAGPHEGSERVNGLLRQYLSWGAHPSVYSEADATMSLEASLHATAKASLASHLAKGLPQLSTTRRSEHPTIH